MKISLKFLLISGLTLPLFFQLFSHAIQVSPILSQIAYGLSKLIFIFFPFIYWKTRKPVQPTTNKSSWLISLVSGLLFSVIIFGILHSLLEIIQPFGESIFKTLSTLGLTKNFLLYSILIITFNSLFEELYWRYTLFGGLQKLVSGSKAAVISSLGFAAMHCLYFIGLFESTWAVILLTSITFGFGLFWCWLYTKTNSIFWVWINHLLVNIPLFYIEYLIIT